LASSTAQLSHLAVSVPALLQIGRKHGILSGKWMLLNLQDKSAEPLWAAVARAVYAEVSASTGTVG